MKIEQYDASDIRIAVWLGLVVGVLGTTMLAMLLMLVFGLCG